MHGIGEAFEAAFKLFLVIIILSVGGCCYQLFKDDPYEELLGVTLEDLEEAVEKCEEALPRNKKCSIKIVFE